MPMDQDWLKQIPIEKGYYLAGFVDGEGSFNVSLQKRPDHAMRWRVILTFNVSQRDPIVLTQLKKYLGCGRMFKRSDGVNIYIVQNPSSIKERIIPFFKRFPFLSANKKRNFSIFVRIANMVFESQHRNKDGLLKIIKLREILNEGKGRKRKYSLVDYQGSTMEPLNDYTPNPAKTGMI
jgi:hypothetical protein